MNFIICCIILSAFSEVNKAIGKYILSYIVLSDNLMTITCNYDVENDIFTEIGAERTYKMCSA